jgi:GT2 family glycosyltransferase
MISRSTKVAYIVVCWNNEAIIGECLSSILAQDYKNTTVYIIDNNSSDNSADYIAEHYKSVQLIRSDSNNGFARGNNLLIKRALEDPEVGYVALINSDAVIEKKWTSEIISYVAGKPRAASAQGITLDYYDHSTIDAEHVYFGDNFQSVQYGYGEKIKKGYMYPRKVFGVNAAAAVYTREFIEDQKDSILFDEKFFMYLEDVDVSFRAVMTGWSNYYIPSAEAYHMGSVSSKKRSSGYNIQMTFRNQSALIFKNMPFKTFIKFLPTALKFERHFYKHLRLTQGKEVSTLARKGRIKGLLRLYLYFGDRRYLRSKRSMTNAQLEKLMKNKGIY